MRWKKRSNTLSWNTQPPSPTTTSSSRPPNFGRSSAAFASTLAELTPQSPICNAPWVSAVVEVNGSVRPCFFHPTIGNINSSSLEDVINGEAAQSFRQSLDIETNPTCRRCVCSLNYRQISGKLTLLATYSVPAPPLSKARFGPRPSTTPKTVDKPPRC